MPENPVRNRIVNMVGEIGDEKLQLNSIVSLVSRRLKGPLNRVTISEEQSIDEKVITSLKKSVEKSTLDDKKLEEIILDWQRKGIPRDEKEISFAENGLLADTVMDITQEFHMRGRGDDPNGGSGIYQ